MSHAPGFATLAALREFVDKTHDLRAAERLTICEALQSSNHVAGIFVVLGLPLEVSALPLFEPEPVRGAGSAEEAAEVEAFDRRAAFELGQRAGVGEALSEAIRVRDVATLDSLGYKSPALARRARWEADGLGRAVEALRGLFVARSQGG